MSIPLSKENYLDTTIKSCQATLSLLKLYKKNNHQLVNTAILTLEQLLENSSVLLFNSNEKNKEGEEQVKDMNAQLFSTQSSKFHHHHKLKQFIPPKLSENWISIDDKTVHIILPNKNIIVAKVVMTEDDLKQVVAEILKTRYVSIDCEFLGVKKGAPLLKVLQLAVSARLGYAILVDHFDISVLRSHLTNILQDKDINRLGWAVRADAQAIEEAFKTEMNMVLDLQAKVYSDAVDKLNLGTAMTKYASSWEGYADFMNAKNLGNSFSFRDQDCIWLQQPLPTSAIIYAVFDVVSLFALFENTSHIEMKSEFYWPNTITKVEAPKAVQKWMIARQQALYEVNYYHDGDNSNCDDNINNYSYNNGNSNSNSSSQNDYDDFIDKKNDSASASKSTEDVFNDDNPIFKANLEKAKMLSLKEQYKKSKRSAATNSSTSASASASTSSASSAQVTTSASSASLTSSASSSSTNLLNVNNNAKYTPLSNNNNNNNNSDKSINNDTYEIYDYNTLGNITMDSCNTTAEDIHFSESIYEPTNRLDYQDLPPEDWGEVDLNNMDGGGWGSDLEFSTTTKGCLHNNKDGRGKELELTNTKTKGKGKGKGKGKSKEDQRIDDGWKPIVPEIKRNPSYQNEPESEITRSITNQPRWGMAYNTKNTGAYSTTPIDAGWNDFVAKSINDWHLGADSAMDEYDKNLKKIDTSLSAKSDIQPNSNTTIKKFNTTVTPLSTYQLSNETGWDKEEDQPVTMMIPLTGTKYKGKLRGPKINNVHDADDLETEDDSDDDDSVGFSNMKQLESKKNNTASDNNNNNKNIDNNDSNNDSNNDNNDNNNNNNNDNDKSSNINENEKCRSVTSLVPIEDTYREYYEFNERSAFELHVIKKYDQLETIDTQHKDGKMELTLALSVHFHAGAKGQQQPKALALTLDNGKVYLILLDKICVGSHQSLIDTKLGLLLMGYNINRITFQMKNFKEKLEAKVGFSLGYTVDLYGFLPKSLKKMNFNSVILHYLYNWNGVNEYYRLKQEMATITQRKYFSGTIWDRDHIPTEVISYSAAQGALFFALYEILYKNS